MSTTLIEKSTCASPNQPPARRNPTSSAVTTKVLCRGKQHRIGINKRGQFILYGHTKQQIQQELNIEELGGEVCRCLQVLRAWRRTIKEGKGFSLLPGVLKAAAKKVQLLQEQRLRTKHHVDWLAEPLPRRPQSARRLIHRLLCRWIKFPSPVAAFTRARLVRQCGQPCWIYSVVLTAEGNSFEFPIDPCWIERVYRRGLVVAGQALNTRIGIVTRNEGHLHYRATQCRSFRVNGRLHFEECIATYRHWIANGDLRYQSYEVEQDVDSARINHLPPLSIVDDVS